MASGLGLKAQGFGFRLVELLGFRGVDGLLHVHMFQSRLYRLYMALHGFVTD